MGIILLNSNKASRQIAGNVGIGITQTLLDYADMEKGADTRTLSAEIMTDCVNAVSMWQHFTQICCQKLKDCGFVTYLMQYL